MHLCIQFPKIKIKIMDKFFFKKFLFKILIFVSGTFINLTIVHEQDIQTVHVIHQIKGNYMIYKYFSQHF